ncbi:hypothetical protein Tco_1132166 [Tanacetum coccineum]|uniref:Uncharacterized protein n=1 Tax=Tanacetum coccineum TaxID=301880 RepID=A0ABQ5JCU8_9ASTR
MNTSPYKDVCSNPPGCAIKYGDYGLAFTKFDICASKVLLLYAVIVFNTRAPSHIDIVTLHQRAERFATLLPLLGLVPRGYLVFLNAKALSKGRTVADSIAERLTRPTAYKFKTDCSIIPVWVF